MNQYQKNQLISLLQTYKPAPNWSWQSLTTAFHSFTSAGVFTSQKKHTDQVKDNQAALFEAFLRVVSDKCSQTPIAKDIDAQGIANLLWAMAKLVDNGLELTPELKEAAAALLPLVNAQNDQFIPQHLANLLRAMVKLGELINVRAVVSTSVSLVHEFGEYSQFTQQELLMALWGLLACSARLYLGRNVDGNDILQQSINKLFAHMQNEPIDIEQD